MGRKYGQVYELIPGRQWRWEIPEWTEMRLDKSFDSEKLVCFTGEKMYFHLSLTVKGVLGFYVNYAGPPPAPKYTYAVGSSKGHVLRQHTAHSVPQDVRRCGHWNVTTVGDIENVIRRTSDRKLVIWFQFDECTMRPTGNPNEWVWCIPRFADLRIGPYYSKAFMPSASPSSACLKLSVNPENRSEVVLSVSHQHARPPCCWFRIANLEGQVLFETPAGQYHDEGSAADPWPTIPYGLLTGGLDRVGMLNVFVRFGDEALQASLSAVGTESAQRRRSMDYHISAEGDQLLQMDDDFDLTGIQPRH